MSYDYTDYNSSNTKAGNLTLTKAWDSTISSYSNPLSSNYISTAASYDSYGNATSTTDANSVETHITYGSVGGYSGLYPTQIVKAYGTGVALTTTMTYDLYTGAVLSATDEDNDITNSTEYDDLGRPVKVITADGTALESWTQTTYDDVNRRIVVKADLETVEDAKKVATQFFDQLGRVRLVKTLEDASTQSATNETDGIKVQTRYKTVSGYTYQLSSNPYRASTSSAETDATMGWTLSTAWSSGIRSEVQTYSGSGLPSAFGGSNSSSTGIVRTDIDANRTLVTDQASKQRISKTNALGQLTDVYEIMAASDASTTSVAFPNTSIAYGYVTSYAYDTLNNLTTVTQGSQTRTFAYSSLSRLTRATNPESGTITYGYDPNGNLTSKVDARSITTSYVYDALNRVTDRNYTNEPSGSETPDVDYFYGTTAPKVGKLTKVQSSVSTTEYTSFDILGRVTGHKQTTDGTDYTTGYTYKLSGALDEQTYPSGRVVKNELDASGDLASVSSKENSSAIFKIYANDFAYNAAGAVTSLKLGNGKFESTQFNSRLQPTQIALGASVGDTSSLKLDYSYGDWNGSSIDATKNNGNIVQQVITTPTVGSSSGFTATQKYYYDSLNRIDDSTETISSTQTWRQDFTYDRYGNRRFNETNTSMPASFSNQALTNPTISTSNNRLTSTGWAYDASGNTTGDPQSRTFIYDGENKQVEVKNSSSATIGQYSYDGDGRRVKKYVPGTGEATIFVYDAAGKQIAEYSTIVADSSSAKVSYLTNDHLGSPRINTDVAGTVTARHDYHPFGEDVTAGRSSHSEYTSDSVRKQFTGYERDGETDLDFAQARYNDSKLGRFSSPDPFDAVSTDLTLYQFNRFLAQPQNWNKYTYCLNNPLRYVDMDGRHPVAALLLALAARAATGAAIGAVVVGGIELMTQMIMGGDINWDRVRNAAIAGAIGGAVTGGASAIPMATFRGLAGKLAVAGVSNGVEGAVQRGLNGEENNIASILTDVLTGAIAYGATKHANELLDRSSKIATQDSVSKISQNYRVSDPPVFGSYIRQNRATQYRNLRTFREFGSDTLTNANGEVMEQIFPNVFPWKPQGSPKREPEGRVTRICDENGKNCEDVQ